MSGAHDVAAEVDAASILADVFELLREHFALEAWGRLQIEIARHPDGDLRVADVQVEGIIGDEAVIERTFGSPAAAQLANVLGKAIEALAALEGVDVEATHGGTFIRVDDAAGAPVAVTFLPGLVTAPSPAFASQRAAVVAELQGARRRAVGALRRGARRRGGRRRRGGPLRDPARRTDRCVFGADPDRLLLAASPLVGLGGAQPDAPRGCATKLQPGARRHA